MRRYELAVMACGHEIEVLVDESVQDVTETLCDVSQRDCPECEEVRDHLIDEGVAADPYDRGTPWHLYKAFGGHM